MRQLLIRFLQWCIRKLNGKYEISLTQFYKKIEQYAIDNDRDHFEVCVIKSPHDKNSVRFRAYVEKHCYTSDSHSIAECIDKLSASKKEKCESAESNVVF